jgi:hypothetical protein
VVPPPPYVFGQEVVLRPLPATSWRFDGWSGRNAGELASNPDGSWTLLMDENKDLTATFTTFRVFVPVLFKRR